MRTQVEKEQKRTLKSPKNNKKKNRKLREKLIKQQGNSKSEIPK